MAIATDAKLPQVPEDAPPATPREVPEMEAEAIERVSAAEARAGQDERESERESEREEDSERKMEREEDRHGGKK